MELHQLRYVLAVARNGNFSRAAEACHVSQPSLSQQIQKLEAELGEKLFDRLKRRAKPTAAGEALIARAGRILGEVEAAQREAQESHDHGTGPLALGVLPTIAPFLLPLVIPAFARQFPGVEIVIQEDTTARLLELLAACEIDLAITSLPIPEDRFAIQKLFDEELLLALPQKHRLAKARQIEIADLEKERFILMKEGHCLGDQVLNFCQRRDFKPQISCRSAQMETIQAFVQAGLGISLVPAMARNAKNRAQPVYRSLAAPRPQRSIAAVWFRQRPPGRAGQNFLKALKESASRTAK